MGTVRSALLASALAAAAAFPFLTAAAPKASGDPAAEFAALKAHCQADAPRPRRTGTFEFKKNGVFETSQRSIARHTWLLALLPSVRGPEPGLVDLVASRIEAEESYMYGNRVGGGFAARLYGVLAGLPSLGIRTRALEIAGDALGVESDKVFLLRTNVMPAAERAERERATDIRARRETTRSALGNLLNDVGVLDPNQNAVWRPLYTFLHDEAERAHAAAAADWADKQSMLSSMRESFLDGAKTGNEPPVLTHEDFKQLEALQQRVNAIKLRILEHGLEPGASPMSVLAGDGRAYADTLIEFDAAMLKALASHRVVSVSGGVRVIDALFPVWDSLDRQERRLKVGGRARTLDRLESLIKTGILYYLAEDWSSAGLDPHSGHEENEPIARQVANTIDVIRRFEESWAEHGRPPKPLYAAVDVDDSGKPAWRLGGWLRWKWIEPDELADLAMDHRVVNGLSRQWLLPAGSDNIAIWSLADVKAAKASEIVLAIDPAGTWTTPNRPATTAASRPGPTVRKGNLATEVLAKLEQTREYVALRTHFDAKTKSDRNWSASAQGQGAAEFLQILRADAMHTRIVRTAKGTGIEYAVHGQPVTDTGILVADLDKDPEYRTFITSAIASVIVSDGKLTAFLAGLRRAAQ